MIVSRFDHSQKNDHFGIELIILSKIILFEYVYIHVYVHIG
jgi:hypothetical protein